MNSFIQVLNYESKMSSEVKPYLKKYCFTSYFTLYFPTIKSNHWVLLSINSLFEKSHFFDPCGTILDTTQQELVYNLVMSDCLYTYNKHLSNYNMLCKLSKKPFKNIFSFKLQPVGPYPKNCLLHDSGHYLPLYMENFEGKAMKSFNEGNIPEYRMIYEFKFFKSTLNKLKEGDLPIPN
ncbi:hypothetical protein VPH35_129128 [Triticum aestivum]